MPFKIIPFDKTIKNRTGLRYVRYCKNKGISSIGEINPDNKTAGIINIITEIIACCWVLQTEDIKSPTPVIASSDINIETKNKIKEPTKGNLKNITTVRVIINVSIIAITKGGIDFPINISNDDKGLTISWSNVPSSLSLEIDKEVKINVVTRDSIATITVKINHLYSRLGLYLFLTSTLIEAPLFFDNSPPYPDTIEEAYPDAIEAEFVCLLSAIIKTSPLLFLISFANSKSSSYFAFFIFKFAFLIPPLNISCVAPAKSAASDDSHEKNVPDARVLNVYIPVMLKEGRNSFLATFMSIFAASSFASAAITSGRLNMTSDLTSIGNFFI